MPLKKGIKWRRKGKRKTGVNGQKAHFFKIASSNLREQSPLSCLIHSFFTASKVFVALVTVNNRPETFIAVGFLPNCCGNIGSTQDE